MTRPHPDEPFPGAHPQVPGAHTSPTRPAPESVYGSGTLPLETSPVRVDGGWLIRLPVRVEEVTVTREPFVRERVVVRRRALDQVRTIEEVVRREELRIKDVGDVEHVEYDPAAREVEPVDYPSSRRA